MLRTGSIIEKTDRITGRSQEVLSKKGSGIKRGNEAYGRDQDNRNPDRIRVFCTGTPLRQVKVMKQTK
jgi:hypothetical protein